MRNKSQRGFSLVSAIFLLVVLAALGAAMVSFSTTQNQSMSLDVMGSRAYQAADAGIEWAAVNIAANPGVTVAATPTFVPGTASALGGQLAPFTVVVGYAAIAQIDAAMAGSAVVPTWSYDITASAALGVAGTPNYVARVVNAKM